MLSITIPLWVLLSVAGLPALILIALSARLIHMKRNHEVVADTVPAADLAQDASTRFDDRIHRQLLDQQIDAVFDVLMTLIDTERFKLKTLVNHALPMAPAETIPAFKVEKAVVASQSQAPAPGISAVPIAQNIAHLAEEGVAAAEIAQRLGLSLTEVALALKMKTGRNVHVGRKVMAVA